MRKESIYTIAMRMAQEERESESLLPDLEPASEWGPENCPDHLRPYFQGPPNYVCRCNLEKRMRHNLGLD